MRLSIKSTMSKKKSCSSNPGMSLPFKTSSTQLKNSEYTLSEIEKNDSFDNDCGEVS